MPAPQRLAALFVRPLAGLTAALAATLLLAGTGCSAEAGGADEEVADESAEAITGSIAAGTALIVNRPLNLRSSPNRSASVRTVMPQGARVTAAGGSAQDGYYRVNYNGQDGYAFGSYLDRSGSGGTGGSAGSGTTRTVTLLWQGNWDFLTRCDRFSEGRVAFACSDFARPSRDFVDNGDWLAAPGSLQGSRNALCGRRVEVCKNGSCVTATIVERSVESSSSTWEGSPHLIRAMGGEGGFTSCTHSWGTVSGVSLRY
ncbi:MAG: SH3 domain-containing protein [Myxococcales bacterium]|nr:SH3 domain-containing protein [Myxococcales bacterium]MBL0193106.1 SH3 domain-containing protein [Myxococcales bacterium]HQY61235.1 SH3 domain-containing protein [Polyangiaceae bacterium]